MKSNQTQMKSSKFYLNWREIAVDEVVERLVLLLQALAHLPVLETAPDPPPVVVIIHPPQEPMRVVAEPILLVPSPGDDRPRALVGDDEGEHGEAEEEEDEHEHDEEVDPEEAVVAAACPGDPGDGDEEDEHAKGDHRAL